MLQRAASPAAGTTRPIEIEQRTAPRHPLVQRCFVRCPETHQREVWRGIAFNISMTGIGLTLPMALPPGTVLEIEPWELPGAQILRARLVHARPVEALWFCGCELSERLSATELQAWLNGSRDWLDKTEG